MCNPPPITNSLVLGDVEGNINKAFAKVATVHNSKAGPFDALFCVGSFLKQGHQEGQTFAERAAQSEFVEYMEGSKAGGLVFILFFMHLLRPHSLFGNDNQPLCPHTFWTTLIHSSNCRLGEISLDWVC